MRGRCVAANEPRCALTCRRVYMSINRRVPFGEQWPESPVAEPASVMLHPQVPVGDVKIMRRTCL